MRLFIAEKPSLARAIADVLPGPKQKRAGYIECGRHDVVTWCAGHILELAEPEDYHPEYKVWAAEHLPIIPSAWKLNVTAPDLLKTIRGLLPHAREVVHAGDPDREGQLLVDEVLEYLRYRGPVSRILVSDLNPPAVRKALGALKPNSDFRGLYDSARARQRADWLFGLNLTRLYTVLGRAGGHDGVLSVGRVQTPLLGLVVRRDLEIEGFTPKAYYVVTADVSSSRGSFQAVWRPQDADARFVDADRRLLDKTRAEQISKNCLGHPGVVISCSHEMTTEPPPLPYCLSELQIDAGKTFGLSPKQTLDACQALYETHRLVTYPRSDCAYLPEGHFSQAPAVLAAVGRNAPSLQALAATATPSLRSRAWNDAKVTAHHALIPTPNVRAGFVLPPAESRVYELVCRRYVAQFYPAHEYAQTRLDLEVHGQHFHAAGRESLNAGWRQVLASTAEDAQAEKDVDDDSSNRLVPVLRQGERVVLPRVSATEKKTLPPKRFTDASLLQAMTGIARFVSDPTIKALLRETDGIGTPATQAAIIQTLFDRGFIEKRGRQIHSTSIARALIGILPPAATTPDMTALWEAAMKKIGAGQMSLEKFLDGVLRQLAELVQRGRARGPLPVPGARPCPAPGCTGYLRRRSGTKGSFWSCGRYPGCSYAVDDPAKSPSFARGSSVMGRRGRRGARRVSS